MLRTSVPEGTSQSPFLRWKVSLSHSLSAVENESRDWLAARLARILDTKWHKGVCPSVATKVWQGRGECMKKT